MDISDTGYNLGCFKWFGTGLGEGMWSVVTYIANLVGHIFSALPGGDSWLGMNIYCSLVVSLLALLAYYFVRPMTGEVTGFLGVYLAIMLCWCPQVILYNYLTYLSLLVGAVLVFYGLTKPDVRLLFIAGIILGLGVGIRISNLTHTALILLVWFDGYLGPEGSKGVRACVNTAGNTAGNAADNTAVASAKTEAKGGAVNPALAATIRRTLICLGGYIVGIAIFVTAVSVQYGPSELLDMVTGLRTMSESVEGYSGASMILSPYGDYLDAMLPWGLILIAFTVLGMLIIKAVKREKVFAPLFVLGLLVIIRLFYGRGMFGIAYHEYFSMVRWASLFNLTALILSAHGTLDKGLEKKERLLSLMSLVMILILPLGSNNRSYPLINDLFLVGPVALFHIRRLVFEDGFVFWDMGAEPKRQAESYANKSEETIAGAGRPAFAGLFSKTPLRLATALVLSVIFIQATGFGTVFVFRDGNYGEKRDTKITNNVILKGMHTRPGNAEAIEELCDFWQNDEGSDASKAGALVLYGDVPGLSYILDRPSAISSSWSNLGSYNMDYWKRDFEALGEAIDKDGSAPTVIIGRDYVPEDEKYDLLMAFIDDYDYSLRFENSRFLIYSR